MGEHTWNLVKRLGDGVLDPVVELAKGRVPLGGRIFIPPYLRLRDGQIEHVDGYWRELGPGGVSELSPDELEAVARSGREHPAVRGTFAKPVSARVQSASMNPPTLERSHRADDPSDRAFDIGTDVPGDPEATAQRRKLRALAWSPGPARGWESAEDEDSVYSRPYGSTDVRRIASLPKAGPEPGGNLPTSGRAKVYRGAGPGGKGVLIQKMRRPPHYSPLWWVADANGEFSESPKYGIDYFDSLAEAQAAYPGEPGGNLPTASGPDDVLRQSLRQQRGVSPILMYPERFDRMDAYIQTIRNKAKKQYATDYMSWMAERDPGDPPPDPPDLSYLAAQAVRIHLDNILQGRDVEPGGNLPTAAPKAGPQPFARDKWGAEYAENADGDLLRRNQGSDVWRWESMGGAARFWHFRGKTLDDPVEEIAPSAVDRLREKTEPGGLLPTAPKKAPPRVKASIRFHETEHTGDLDRYWDDLGPIAAKHGVKFEGMQALEDVDEDDDRGSESGFGPTDGFYDGGGRYEEGIIEVSGEQKNVKAFLREAQKTEAGGFMGGVARLQWLGDPPPKPRMTTGPLVKIKPTWERPGGPIETQEVRAKGKVIATMKHYPRTSSYPGSSYAPEPDRWMVDGGVYPTREAALKAVKRNYRPPVTL